MDAWIIILGIIIVVILFFLIRYYFFSTNSLVSYADLSTAPADISSNVITNPNSILYSFGTWVYVSNFTNSTIFSYAQNGHSGITGNQIMGNQNILFSLIIGQSGGIGTSNSPVLTACVAGKSGQGSSLNTVVISNNFPIQKWVHVLVSVDTMYIDCYLDGKLVISSPVRNQITNSPSSTPAITFAQPPSSASPQIKITKLTRWDHPLDPQSVWNEYSAGNGLSQGGNLTVGLFVDSDTGKNNYKIYSNT
jgi:hypothetical protein